MDKFLKVVLALTAVDRMSAVVRRGTNNAISDIDKLRNKAAASFGKGAQYTAAGAAIVASLAPAVSKFAELEDAQTSLEISMMNAAGKVAPEYKKIADLAVQLGNKLPGNTADFALLFETMRNNGVESQVILDGVGKSAAYLAVALKMPYDEAGKFAAKMKEATGVANSDMMAFMDTIARTRNLGVEAGEMQYAFGRSAGALKLMSVQGLDASKQIASVYAELIRAGLSGETVGTGFASIMNNMLNPDKYAAFKVAAAEAGVQLKMFEKGKFLGVENFIQQLDKLQKMSAGKRAGIVNALTGGGQDAQMMQILIDKGVTGFQKMNAQMNAQADLSTKVERKLKTLSSMWEAATGTIDNMLAALGAGLGPELKAISAMFGKVAEMVGKFLNANPAFAKFIGLATAAVGIFLSVVGVINLLKGAFMMLRVVMMANPFILIAMIAVVAIAAIYANWGKISAWFAKLWAGIKRLFSAAWEGIKSIVLGYTPAGLIYSNWGKITEFFTNVWAKVKDIFANWVSWVMNLGGKFYNAGANIVSSIWKGIKSMANKPIEAIADMTKKMREYLPFSPAKMGAFRDIHRVKIVETIAASIKPTPVTKAIGKVTQAATDVLNGRANSPGVRGSSGMGASVSLTFAPVISGGGDSASVLAELKKYSPQLLAMLRAEMDRQNRKSFAD